MTAVQTLGVVHDLVRNMGYSWMVRVFCLAWRSCTDRYRVIRRQAIVSRNLGCSKYVRLGRVNHQCA